MTLLDEYRPLAALAASAKPLRSALKRATSPRKNRVRGFALTSSGRRSRHRRLKLTNATGYRACSYKTASGRARWLSRDPIGEEGGINLYGYVANNPVNLIDPLGLIDVGFYGAGGNTVGNAALRDYVSKRGGQTYDRTQAGQQQALAAIQAAKGKDPCEPVNVHGYSWGTRAARDLVNKLDSLGINVDQLNLIDPVNALAGPGSITVPNNVQSADNYYQTSGGPFRGGPAANPSSTVRNHDVSGPGVNHNTIVGNVLGH